MRILKFNIKNIFPYSKELLCDNAQMNYRGHACKVKCFI